MSYANGIWLADLDTDAWKLKIHHGFLQPFGSRQPRALHAPTGRGWPREMAAASELRRAHPRRRVPEATQRHVPLGARRLSAGSPAQPEPLLDVPLTDEQADSPPPIEPAVVWLIEQLEERV